MQLNKLETIIEYVINNIKTPYDVAIDSVYLTLCCEEVRICYSDCEDEKNFVGLVGKKFAFQDVDVPNIDFLIDVLYIKLNKLENKKRLINSNKKLTKEQKLENDSILNNFKKFLLTNELPQNWILKSKNGNFTLFDDSGKHLINMPLKTLKNLMYEFHENKYKNKSIASLSVSLVDEERKIFLKKCDYKNVNFKNLLNLIKENKNENEINKSEDIFERIKNNEKIKNNTNVINLIKLIEKTDLEQKIDNEDISQIRKKIKI